MSSTAARGRMPAPYTFIDFDLHRRLRRRPGERQASISAGASIRNTLHVFAAKPRWNGTLPIDERMNTRTCDPLRDEGRAYARRLEQDGVRVTHLHFADQMHGFLSHGRIVRAGNTALDMATAALRWAT
jgi:acetyl esterase/lipase